MCHVHSPAGPLEIQIKCSFEHAACCSLHWTLHNMSLRFKRFSLYYNAVCLVYTSLTKLMTCGHASPLLAGVFSLAEGRRQKRKAEVSKAGLEWTASSLAIVRNAAPCASRGGHAVRNLQKSCVKVSLGW